MTNSKYKVFKCTVAHADEQDKIWWNVYDWIALTPKQYKDILVLLETKPFIKPCKAINGKVALKMPNGWYIHCND